MPSPGSVLPICVILNVILSPDTKSSVPSVFSVPAVNAVAAIANCGFVAYMVVPFFSISNIRAAPVGAVSA